MEKTEIIKALIELKDYSSDMKKQYKKDDEMYPVYERDEIALENAIKIIQKSM